MLTEESAPERFRCTACGACCRKMRVVLTHRDIERLGWGAQDFGVRLDWLAPDEVDMTNEPGSFVELSEGRRLMTLAWEDGGCALLQPPGLCGVYEQRPMDCRIYPFDFSAAPPVLLPLLDECEAAWDGTAELNAAAPQDRERWRELAEYQALLVIWNRAARHRRRMGRTQGPRSEFLLFLRRKLDGLKVGDDGLAKTGDTLLAQEPESTSA